MRPRSPFHRDALSEAHTAQALGLRPVDQAARQLRADVENPPPPPPPPPADPADEARDNFAEVMRRALSGKRKPGLAADLTRALSAGAPMTIPEAPATGEAVALNDGPTLEAIALGALNTKEQNNG